MSRPKTVQVVSKDDGIYVQTEQKLDGIMGVDIEFLGHDEMAVSYDLDPWQLDAAIASARKLFGIQAGRAPLRATVILG